MIEERWAEANVAVTLLRGVSDTLGDSGRSLRKVHGARTLP